MFFNKKMKAENEQVRFENQQLKKELNEYKEFIEQKKLEEDAERKKIDKQWCDFWNYDGTPQEGLSDD